MGGVPVRQRFGKTKPCRICRKGSGFCSERIDDLIFCGHADPAVEVEGYRFVRRLAEGMGSLWAPIALLSDDLSQIGKKDAPLKLPTGKGKAKTSTPAVDEPAATKPKGLPETARATANKNLSRQLELKDSHRRSLMEKRGLSGEQVEQLEREGFRSIDHGQRFPGVEGPGFQSGGQYSGPAGLLIPSRNDFGEIVGYQVAPDDQNGSGKYKWISSSENPVAIEDQWPVFQGQTDRETSLAYLVDGALKAALTGMLMDVPSIGVPGARFCTSGTQLLRVLARIMPPTQDERLVVLCVDAGDVVNTSDMPTNLLGCFRLPAGARLHRSLRLVGPGPQGHRPGHRREADRSGRRWSAAGSHHSRPVPPDRHGVHGQGSPPGPVESPNRCPLGRQRNRAANPGDHPAGPRGLPVREGAADGGSAIPAASSPLRLGSQQARLWQELGHHPR